MPKLLISSLHLDSQGQKLKLYSCSYCVYILSCIKINMTEVQNTKTCKDLVSCQNLCPNHLYMYPYIYTIKYVQYYLHIVMYSQKGIHVLVCLFFLNQWDWTQIPKLKNLYYSRVIKNP